MFQNISQMFNLFIQVNLSQTKPTTSRINYLKSIRLQDGTYPLHYASANGYLEVVKILLDDGANPDAQEGMYQETALHWYEFCTMR